MQLKKALKIQKALLNNFISVALEADMDNPEPNVYNIIIREADFYRTQMQPLERISRKHNLGYRIKDNTIKVWEEESEEQEIVAIKQTVEQKEAKE